MSSEIFATCNDIRHFICGHNNTNLNSYVRSDGKLTPCGREASHFYIFYQNGRVYARCKFHRWSYDANVTEVSWREALVFDVMGS